MELIKKYFAKEINILGSVKSRSLWFLIWVIAILSLAVLFLFCGYIISSFGINAPYANMVAFGAAGVVFIFFVIILFRIFLENKLRGYILLTLFFSAIAFIVEKYFLNNEIFSPFTARTTVLLWISFITLTASLFYQKISKWILLFFPPILLVGFLVSFCFILIMLPFMLFGWIAILFLGFGILPYTPLMAAFAFLVMGYRSFSELKENEYYLQYTFSKYLTYGVLIFTSIYFIWFHTEWNRGQFIIRNHFLENKIINSKRSLIDDDLPAWASLGMKLPVNHVSELYLQPELDNRGRQFTFFGSDKLFDPFAFVVSNISKKADISNEDREHLLKILFGYTHIRLDRLWNGNSLLTTDIETILQFYPQSRVAYTEMKLSVYNASQSGQQEAIYTFKIPDGSVCTKLSLWIDGKEEPARLTFLSKAKAAYETIVGVERRDPSYVTWMEDNLLRVRVFPVVGKNYRTFKIGFISPLAVKNDKLLYKGFEMEGPISDTANHKIDLYLFESKDINLSGNGYSFEKKVTRKIKESIAQWFAYGKYKEGWDIYLDNPKNTSEESRFSDLKLQVSPLEWKEKDFHPKNIYVLINSSLSKKEWKNTYLQLAALDLDSQIILVTSEWFHSKNQEENLDFIESQVLPKFNLFPFYKITNETDILIVTNKEDSSIPFSELKGSTFYSKNKEFFSKNKKEIYVQSLSGNLSTYFNSLKEYDLIQNIPISIESIFKNLKSKKILIPEQSPKKFSLPDSNITVEVETQTTTSLKKGNDLLTKLILYKKIMRDIGKRMKDTDKDTNETALFDLAEFGMIVTPLTSLIVLETENDYNRFGIHKNKKGVGVSELQVENSTASGIKHGNVPEPEEWMIFIICIALFILWKKFKLNRA